MQQLIVSKKMALFTTLQDGEEAVDQAKYHYQTLANATTTLDFFGATISSAAGGIRDTNVPKANALVDNPKRFALQAICVDVVPGVNPSQKEAANAALNTFINDVWGACSVGAFQLKLIDTVVLTMASLASLPAGRGLGVAAAAAAFSLGVAADQSMSIGYAANGLPSRQAIRWLQVPLPIQAETSVYANVSYTAPGVVLSASARMGVIAEGLEFRPGVNG